MTFKTPVAIIKQRKHAKMIKASQAKLAETKLVPGYTKIYA